ncbi:Protein F10D11.6 b, partial [Aphelenchoides avenae]
CPGGCGAGSPAVAAAPVGAAIAPPTAVAPPQSSAVVGSQSVAQQDQSSGAAQAPGAYSQQAPLAVAPPPADNAPVNYGSSGAGAAPAAPAPPAAGYRNRRVVRILSADPHPKNQAPLLLPPLISAGSSHSSHAHRRYVVLNNTTQHFLQRSKRLAGTAGVVVMQRPPRARAYAASYQETAPGAAVAAPGSAAVASPGSAVAAVPAPAADAGVSGGSSASSTGTAAGAVVDPADPCASCPGANAQSDSSSIINTLVQSLDLNKLNNILLNVQLLNTYATNSDFTVDLNGEFSPNAAGGTPFGAFPMQFPPSTGRMAEILVSDFTVNSLFYHLHRVGFINIRLGPETPSLGPLLKTTCSEDEELEDHGVETDEEASTPATAVLKKRRTRRADPRLKRQDDGGGLSDLGICFGDLLPAIRERYPNRNLAITVRTAKAPSLVFSPRNGGTATGEIVADADISIDGTNEKIGTITVTATFDITVRTNGNNITGHAEITSLRLADNAGTLGLTQDTLDNLANLGKDLVQK